MPRRKQVKSGRRAARVPRNYTLPNSTPYNARAFSRGDIPVGFAILTKQMAPVHLCPDVSGSGIRKVLFDHFTFTFTPPQSSFALNLANVFTAQVFAIAITGDNIPVSGVCVLSMTNPRKLRVRIPEWLIFPADPSTNNPFLEIVWRMSNNAVTSNVSVAMEVEARGRMTNMEVNNF